MRGLAIAPIVCNKLVMSPSKPIAPLDQTLMTQALADAVGATKRQIQFWTGHGIRKYLPGTGGGQGRQRLYPRTELPFAAMARYLANAARVSTIRLAVFGARMELNPTPGLKGARPRWCRQALLGEIQSYMVIAYHLRDGKYEPGFSWSGPDKLIERLPLLHGFIIINVQKVLSPYAE